MVQGSNSRSIHDADSGQPPPRVRRASFEPGSRFGEYTIVRRIGRGGQGSVFEVTDSLGLTWALKVSEEMALQDANAEMRFSREARCVAETLCGLPRHSGVFVGEHYGVWERRFYVKMKLLRGESLAQRLRRVGQLPIFEAVHIAERVAFAIGQAHELKVLHRDLKPENIFLTDEGEVLVLDWGCLQLLEAGQVRTTLRGVICTPGYAPIEQYLATSALNLTPAVDLYALGVILYEALAGYHPFLNWSRAAVRPRAEELTSSPAARRGHPLSDAAQRFVQGEVSQTGGPLLHKDSSALLDDDHTLEREAGGAVVTVRLADDVFGARTERHHVPPELLSHLREIVTGGVTWPSLPDAPRAGPEASQAPGTHRTHVGQPVQLVDAPPSGGSEERDSWFVSRADQGNAIDETALHATRTAPGGRGATVVEVAPPKLLERPGTPVSVHKPPKGDVPRRFSLVEVLAFQERVKPRPVEGVPAELTRLIAQLLCKRPADRPQDALTVGAALRVMLPRLREAPAEFAASTPEQNSRYLSRALLRIRLRQYGRQWAFAAVGVVAAMGAGAGTYYGMSLSRATEAQPLSDGLSSFTAPLHSVAGAPAAATISALARPSREEHSLELPPVSNPSPRGDHSAVLGGVPIAAGASALAPSVPEDKALRKRAKSRARSADDTGADSLSGGASSGSSPAPRDQTVRRSALDTRTQRPSTASPVSTASTVAASSKPSSPEAASASSTPPAKPTAPTGNERRLKPKPNAVLHGRNPELWMK